MALKKSVRQEIEKILNNGKLKRSNSPFINPLPIVLKKNGDIRLCLDARRLNEILINDYECSKPIEAIFQCCVGTKIMPTLDLLMSFWLIPLSPESSKYTTFLFDEKCYEFFWFKNQHSSAGTWIGHSPARKRNLHSKFYR